MTVAILCGVALILVPTTASAGEIAATLTALKDLAGTIGPAAAALFVALVLVLFFYRRDFLVKQNGLKEVHDRRDKREERFTESQEKIAVALNELSGAIRRTEEQRARDTAEIIRAVRDT